MRIHHIENSAKGFLNSLRSFSNERLMDRFPYAMQTFGAVVLSAVEKGGGIVIMEMGEVSFNNQRVPVAEPKENFTLHPNNR